MSYEAAAVWQQATTDCSKGWNLARVYQTFPRLETLKANVDGGQTTCRLTISQLANGAFNSSYKFLWGAIFLAIILIGGLLTAVSDVSWS
jgi:hypothetical protein